MLCPNCFRPEFLLQLALVEGEILRRIPACEFSGAQSHPGIRADAFCGEPRTGNGSPPFGVPLKPAQQKELLKYKKHLVGCVSEQEASFRFLKARGDQTLVFPVLRNGSHQSDWSLQRLFLRPGGGPGTSREESGLPPASRSSRSTRSEVHAPFGWF